MKSEFHTRIKYCNTLTLSGGWQVAPMIRLLCLHGWRTSGSIMQDQLSMALWQKHLDGVAELIFLDAPHPAKGNKADTGRMSIYRIDT